MTRRWFLAPLALTLLLTPVAAAQQTAQQGQADSVAAAAAALIAQAQTEGALAATNVGTGGWFAGGFASGVVLGLIGTGVTWAIAGSSDATLPADRRLLIANRPTAYQQFYEKSYGDKVKSKRKTSALVGGLVGTATFLVIYLSASANY